MENNIHLSEEAKKEEVKKVVEKLGVEGFKNKNDYAVLQAYLQNYDEAVASYLQAGNYQKAFKYYNRVSN